MATIVTIQSSDLITNSRADINTSLANLNTDKIETSVIDTDTALAANSDAKIATQKAVKAYVDAGGNVNASTIVRGIVEEATQAEVNAGTAAGSTARLFVNPSTLSGVIVALGAHTKYAAGTNTHNTASDGADNNAHSMGVAPTMVKITCYMSDTGMAATMTSLLVGGAQKSVFAYWGLGSGTGNAVGVTARIYSSTGGHAAAVITTDATNVVVTWTGSGSPTGTVNYMWEAYY